MEWYDPAIKVTASGAGGFAPGYAPRGVIHTTEGATASGAISTYRKNNSWPHFTVDWDGRVFQHISIAVAARALRNLAGGVETNKAKCIQIEVVGFASKPLQHSLAQKNSLKKLMRWIEDNAGVKPEGPGRPFASGYGQNALRFNQNDWKAFNAWCGHCHVPENSHWDPGLINISELLPEGVLVLPDFNPPFDINNIVSALVDPVAGGAWILDEVGHIYAFGGARYLDAPASHPDYWNLVGQKAAQLRPSDNGLGYVIIDNFGNRYNYDG